MDDNKVIEEVVKDEAPPEGEKPIAVSPEEFRKMQAALKEANKESATRRKQLEAFEKAEADRKLAELSEIDKANALLSEEQKKREKIEGELSDTLIKAEIKITALELGFADVADAYNLIDKSAIVIEGGEVKGVKEALEKLAKSKPYLIKQKGDGVGTARGDKKRTAPENKPTYKIPTL